MPRVGAKLRHRHAQKPVRAPKTTRARDTSGSRNWHLHKSAHNQPGGVNEMLLLGHQILMLILILNPQVRSRSSPLLWFPGSRYLGVNC